MVILSMVAALLGAFVVDSMFFFLNSLLLLGIGGSLLLYFGNSKSTVEAGYKNFIVIIALVNFIPLLSYVVLFPVEIGLFTPAFSSFRFDGSSVSIPLLMLMMFFISILVGINMQRRFFKALDMREKSNMHKGVLAFERYGVIAAVTFFALSTLKLAGSILYGWTMGSAYDSGWIAKALNVTPFMFISIIYLFLVPSAHRFVKSLIVLGFLILILGSIIMGSRSSLYTQLFSVLTVLFCLKGNYWLSKRALTILGVIGLSASIAFFIAGSAARGVLDDATVDLIFKAIVFRLGAALDNFLIITSITPDRQFDFLLSLPNTIMRGINSVVPGSVFSIEDYTHAGSLFKQIFWGVDASHLHGDWWSGVGYLYYNYGIAGLLCASIVSGVSTALIRVLKATQTLLGVLISVFIFDASTFVFMNHGDFDSIIQSFLYNAIYAPIVVVYLVLTRLAYDDFMGAIKTPKLMAS